MKQIQHLKKLFERHEEISDREAKDEGIKHLRQQVYFLRQKGYRIINTDKKTYKML